MATVINPYSDLEIPFKVNNFHDKTMPFLEIVGDKYKARFSSFNIIKFEDLVHFNKTNLSIGLSFENCIFKGPLVFSNITAAGYDDMLNPDSQSLVFKNCVFTEIVNFFGKDAIIDRTVLFEDSKFENGLNIEYLNIGAL